MSYVAKQATVTVGGVELTGYKTESGQWVMSLSSLASVLGLAAQSASNFLKSNWLKSRIGGSFTPLTEKIHTEGNSQPIVAINTELAALFFRFQDSRNDHPVAKKLVDALMSQALNIRFEGNLTPLDTYANVENRALTIQEARQQQLEIKAHNYFQNWMLAKRFSLAVTHDYLTTRLVGRTAKQSRLMPQTCDGIAKVGLNHWSPAEVESMDLATQVKLFCADKFVRNRKHWTYKDYLDHAINQLAD